MLGATLAVVSVALFARYFRCAGSRAAFTAMGVFLFVYWLLGAGDRLPSRRTTSTAASRCSSSVASRWSPPDVRADLQRRSPARPPRRHRQLFSTLIPSIRTAVAYPLANKFRTGMTISMISLVVFALVMMATMNANFNRIFLSSDALGGYDVQVVQNPNNQIADLKAAL